MLYPHINSDTELIRRLQEGDKNALTQLYNQYWEPLYIASYNLLKNNNFAEDIVQEVFINIWKSREKLEIKISLQSYLYACVRHQVFSHFRKNKDKLNQELFESLDNRFQYSTPETELMHQELVHHINTIVDTLPKKCRLVFKLSREEQLSHKEISERLNISQKTIENHITKALKILRTSMGAMLSIELLLWLY